ncbi:MAG: hypothetical protein KIT36_16320 [Alphaproteobacteria bacterium]|nr:hypothetical protein [Alphaproteobacteria bacterium]
MRTERDILDLIARAVHEKEVRRRREAERQAEELDRRRIFLQAARAVFTHVVMPEMERFGGILHAARLRSTVSDTGAFYLPGSADATLIAKFSLPMPREQVELPLCIAFEAVFPVGMAVYFCDADGAEEDIKGPAEQVSLEDVTPEFVEDRLVRVLENYLHEM